MCDSDKALYCLRRDAMHGECNAQYELARYYEVILVGVNVVIAIVALIVTLLARVGWSHSLEQIDLGGASVIPTMILTLSYFIGITCLDIFIVRRRLLYIWRG